jgi:tetrahydromethanopterin S-methyltransferase subunit G
MLLLDLHQDQERTVPDAAKSNPKPRSGARTAGASRARAASAQTRPRKPPAGDDGPHGTTQDRLGRALSDLLENPLVTGAIGRAFGAREKAAQAQELWMGALNLPSAADIERLTRRLRSVSQRLEGVEDNMQLLGRSILQNSAIESRLQDIDARLDSISDELGEVREAVLRLAGSASQH